MCKLYLHILFILIAVPTLGQFSKSEKIKLKTDFDCSLFNLQNDDYIISFKISDLNLVQDKLNTSFILEPNDTMNFTRFVKMIDSTGRGNWINNYRLNIALRELIDTGDVKIYSISKNKYIKRLIKRVEGSPNVGVIFCYYERKKTIIQFSEAFVGCPVF